jgi:hypothetical protein
MLCMAVPKWSACWDNFGEGVCRIRLCKRYMQLVRQCAKFVQLEMLRNFTKLYSVTFQKTSF